MKAAILEELGKPLVISDISITKLDVGQVLVKVHCSGICGKQIGEISGHFGPDKFLPHLLGHEGGGEVLDVGPGVTCVKPGDHVVMHWRKGKGIESSFPRYTRLVLDDVGGGLVTTFNEYAVVSENRLTSIPKEVPFEIAALMGCSVTTALGLINNEAELKMGQSIAVFGCGGVGLNIIQGAKMVSAHPIIGIDIVKEKIDMAFESGATFTINSSEQNVKHDVFDIVGKKGFDVFIECTGKVDNIALAYELTASNGKTILVGQPKSDEFLSLDYMAKNYGGKKLFASQGGLTDPHQDIPRYINLYQSGKLDLDSIILNSKSFTLDDINLALDVMRTGNASKCFIMMGDN